MSEIETKSKNQNEWNQKKFDDMSELIENY